MEEVKTGSGWRNPEYLQSRIRCIDKNSIDYPEKMKELPGMPEKIYVIGEVPRSDLPSISIVGARASSPYGRIQAFRYAKILGSAGIQVISGLAAGIDSEGHKGALEGSTPTYAVLGCGVDICYPKYNRSLYYRILEQGGGILSEYAPGTMPFPRNFPARNRIISALSDVVLVVEAKEKSGSLITAGFALEQSRSIYAIPGPVNEELSRGCHKLIYDGAGIAYCPEILLQEWGISKEENTFWDGVNNLTGEQQKILSLLNMKPKNPDYLMRKSGMTPQVISNVLVELILLGMVEEVGKRYYIRRF